ncbi:hypothetical protein PIB30_114767, partial [Stylosanthes scabra]|nr:hypothetical protein [Stylosanthes scabra]
MSGKSSAYDRFKAHLLSKAKKPATLAGSGSGVSKPTSPEVVPPSSSSIPDSSSGKDVSASPSPSIISTQEGAKDFSRKRKVPEP